MDTQARPSFTTIYSRVQMMLRQRRAKRTAEISAPFDFKLEPISLPGVSDEEIAILREKAAASCIGIAEAMPHSASTYTWRHARHQSITSYITVLPPFGMTSDQAVW